MHTLRYGDKGLFVKYLQMALLRAEEDPGEFDGIFGRRTERALTAFQDRFGIRSDGVAERLTFAALFPYLCGSTVAFLREGDTPETLAERFQTTPERIRTANPSLTWTADEHAVIPLGFDAVITNVPYSSFLTVCVLEGLTLRYPFLVKFSIGTSVAGKPIEAIRIGAGPLRETATKPDCGRDAQGNIITRSFEEIAELARVSKIPVVVGGGVKLPDIPALARTGVDGFFVVSAVAGAPDPGKAGRCIRGCQKIPVGAGPGLFCQRRGQAGLLDQPGMDGPCRGIFQGRELRPAAAP